MTYAIPRYPVHLIDVVRLVDGGRVTIRPTLPQDAELQREFFRCLSAERRYSRFMTRLNELPETLVESFASIDYCRHLALLAELFEDGRETMIGEARYVIDASDPETCEFAIAVADNWQARGIARTLLDRLERQAAASGIRRMVADTLDHQQGDDPARYTSWLHRRGRLRGCVRRAAREMSDRLAYDPVHRTAGSLRQSDKLMSSQGKEKGNSCQ